MDFGVHKEKIPVGMFSGLASAHEAGMVSFSLGSLGVPSVHLTNDLQPEEQLFSPGPQA